ncbi:MAG TPA: ribosome small subunit-dependent GTPase A [Candidatus Alectryocaccobium stercorigallinarum]|jgi:ribosome biogenesis GTPase|nr:ribosome small subunit-dependent GTPase A [Candidatus Alectryocaccobium stercorigallinarum]
MTGKIIKGIAGFYYVEVAGSGVYQCKAKGSFRKEKLKPLVGDEVRITVTHEKDMEANIEEIFPRRNELYRPAAANVDQVLVVMAFADPKPDYYILDRFLVQMEITGLHSVICFNKDDLATQEKAEEIRKTYESAGYDVIMVSAAAKTGAEELRRRLAGKTTVLAGPSGVGKSSIVNLMSSSDIMETGEISEKLKRGKNTTRHAQLIVIGENTYICDTPGFTSFEAENISSGELRRFFPEIWKYEGNCRFNGCVHVSEPECRVKEEVEKGNISKLRYGSYTRLFEELKEKEKNKYK